jgi:hypothetical protein
MQAVLEQEQRFDVSQTTFCEGKYLTFVLCGKE